MINLKKKTKKEQPTWIFPKKKQPPLASRLQVTWGDYGFGDAICQPYQAVAGGIYFHPRFRENDRVEVHNLNEDSIMIKMIKNDSGSVKSWKAQSCIYIYVYLYTFLPPWERKKNLQNPAVIHVATRWKVQELSGLHFMKNVYITTRGQQKVHPLIIEKHLKSRENTHHNQNLKSSAHYAPKTWKHQQKQLSYPYPPTIPYNFMGCFTGS